MTIEINKIRPGIARQKPADDKLGFGVYMSNHMFTLKYSGGEWHSPKIEPYGPLLMEPASVVLHYAQEVFEGLKAYYGADGKISLFRPEANMDRMNNSCERMCIPRFPKDLVMEAMIELVKLDRDWVPTSPGTSLYIRPTIIATEPFLGVRPANEYLYFIITSPVGAYYSSGFGPIKIMVEDKYTRAAFGGVGEAKTSGNYAASLKAQEEAHAKGFTQVLWLDGKERKYVEEVGTMNMVFKFKDEVATAPLGGTILPGITRDSVLTMCRDMGLTVNERLIAVDEIIEKTKNGELVECFGTGTAAVISPVGSLNYKGEDFTVGDGQTGELSQKLFDMLTGYQYGSEEDPYNWRMIIG